MKPVVRCLCLLIIARLCEATVEMEGMEVPENCTVKYEFLCFNPCGDYLVLRCPDLIMALHTFQSTSTHGEKYTEYLGRIICESYYMPYNYLPNLKSTRNSLELQRCLPPEHGSFGEGWPKLEHLTFTHYGTIEPLNRRHFSGLNNVWHLKLFLIKSPHVMPDDIFTDLTELRELELTVQEANANIFNNLTKLVSLRLTISSLEGADNFDTSELKNLTVFKTLVLFQTDLTRLTKRFLEGFRNLETLDIQHCKIEAIDADAFESLTNLKNFHLIRNHPISLSEGLFKKNLKLQKVFIDNSNLVSLPSGLFSYLPDLRKITIRSSVLTSIPNDFIRDSFNLEILDLQFNKLTSLPRDLLQNHSELNLIALCGNSLNETSDLFDNMSPRTKLRFNYYY